MPPRLSTRTSATSARAAKRKLPSIDREHSESDKEEKEDKDRDYLDIREGGNMSGGMAQHHQQIGVGVGVAGPSMDQGSGGMGPGMADDGDNRTRNARAQRRHREKRKAMTAALEAAVQTLTSQLEEARRQLGQSFRAHAISPGSREFTQLQAENAYLRDENADLRRQLYSHRVGYGHMPPPSGPGGEQPKVEAGNGFGIPYATSSPRGEAVRRSGDYDRAPNGEGGSSAPSSTSSYPPHVDQFAPIDHRSRRVLSAGSLPNTSPYLASDPRSIETRYPSTRYEPMYNGAPANAPPPHNMPRSSSMYEPHIYAPREEGGGGDSHAWPSETSGPPPFPAYTSDYPAEGQNGEWHPEQ